MGADPLQIIPVERWCEIQEEFKKDWPRGISGYTVLQEQRKWHQKELNYGFHVYCPYGEVTAGLVAINDKKNLYEVILQCPTDDTSKLESALLSTELINWKQFILVPFAPKHVIECIKRVVQKLNISLDLILPSESFILHSASPLFEESWIKNHPDLSISLLSEQHTDLVDSLWPHRYPNSKWYFDKLIKAESGYGLFKNKKIVSWVFINEAGTLGHMYTIENYRKMGYGEILLKHVCNVLLKDQVDVFAFCVKGNVGACKLYAKVGFGKFDGVAWCYLNKKCQK